MYGKSIELFLVNGTADSLITAVLLNWNGQAIKIPRNEAQTCQRDDVAKTGVYFLFCQDDNDNNSVYIGEAENIIERLRQHLRDYKSGQESYYWNTAVIFVGRDLNKTLIRYLEDRLVKIARDCGRYKVLTKNTYSQTVTNEAQKAAMEEFIDNIKILIAILGYDVLVETPSATENTEYLFCKRAGVEAKGFISSEGFTIVEGSKVSENVSSSFKARGGYYKLRVKLENEGVISNGTFTRNYEFKSPSAASAVVIGNTSNGNVDWKNKDGVKLRDL